MTGYPWQPGDQLLAADLNAAFAYYTPIGGPFLSLSGGTMLGGLTLAGDPASPLQAATKAYVDNGLALKLNTAGGTMAGPLTLFGPPTADAHAATKAYVDAHAGGGLPDAPSNGTTYGRLNIAWTPVLPLTGGVLSGPVTVGGLTTLNGGLTITNDPTTPISVTTTITDPLAETIPNQVLTNLFINSNNAQDNLSFTARMHIKTAGGGVTFSSQHTPAVYGETSATDTVAGGTVVWAAGVQGVSGNNGVGTVTNACDFLGHPTVNTAGGVVTNHYILFGPSSVPGKAANEYGFYMPAPSGIGTATPVGWIEVRTPDSLSTTRVARFRNSGGSLMDIMGDSKIGMFGVAPVVRQTVSGAWAGNTAGKALCVALAAFGWIIDSTTA